MTHPCQDKCPNFTDEQCCHCLIKVDQNDQPCGDEQKHLERALSAQGEIS